MGSFPEYVSWKRWRTEQFGHSAAYETSYYRKEFALCESEQLRGRRVLEIGFGNGTFAGWVREQGAVYLGTEAISELVSVALSNGFNVFAADTPFSKIAERETIDVVVAFDVFEHLTLEQLESMLTDIGTLLRPGGWLLGRVPSGDSPFARSVQYGDLTHSLVLGSSAIGQLASRVGLGVLSIREPAFPLFGAGWISLLRRAALLMTRRITFPLISNIFMGGGSPILTPNMVFVLTKPR